MAEELQLDVNDVLAVYENKIGSLTGELIRAQLTIQQLTEKLEGNDSSKGSNS